MRYKAVIFDLFGTLVEKFPVDESLKVLEEIADVLHVDFKELTRAWWESFDERHSGRFGSLEEDFRNVAHRLGAKPTDEQVGKSAQIDIEYVLKHITPKPGAVELLAYLKGKGLETGLVSNWSDEIPRIWQDVPISVYFDVVVFSCNVHLLKPDPRIYNLALEELNADASECLYVGDGDSREIDGAKEVGMDAVLIGDAKHEGWTGLRISTLDEVKDILN